ncbi:MAG TPA: imidazole glycerol phosphate synthase subunit HisH, partial [Paracoccus sp. (in: a-proteobacteria)]|nr:imidazole glycerol phosphate synthase subunit HisH [Paracoccus sp. (in: a-proteobacteria)]
MRVALIDYESGNLHSAEKAFARVGRDLGAEIAVTSDPDAVARADRIVLPGDGAFPACRAAFDAVPGMAEALDHAVQVRAVPFLGICVGMQMLADRGLEYRETPGFGLIHGRVDRIRPADSRLKVPHMGWNT